MSNLHDFVTAEDLSRTEDLELLSKKIVDGFLSGKHRSRLKGGCAEFAEHKAYYPGDAIRLLDWRVYGKTDRYCIKQFEEETSLQAVIVMDASGSMDFGLSTASKFNYSRAAALCLARLVLRQGDAASLAVIGGGVRSYIPARPHPGHLPVLIEELKAVKPSGKTSLAEDLMELGKRIKRRGLVILFSDCFDDLDRLGQVFGMLRARRHEILLFHVLAPEELDFSFDRFSRFESLERRGQFVDLDPLTIREEYLDRMREFVARARQVCGDAACDYVPLVTNQPLADALGDYLRRRLDRA